jgi:hypothetical protein
VLRGCAGGGAYLLRLRIGMSRLRVWCAWGRPVRHLVPYNAELAPKDERRQGDQEEPEEKEWERDQPSEERTRCYFTVADGRDRWLRAPQVSGVPSI